MLDDLIHAFSKVKEFLIWSKQIKNGVDWNAEISWGISDKINRGREAFYKGVSPILKWILFGIIPSLFRNFIPYCIERQKNNIGQTCPRKHHSCGSESVFRGDQDNVGIAHLNIVQFQHGASYPYRLTYSFRRPSRLFSSNLLAAEPRRNSS